MNIKATFVSRIKQSGFALTVLKAATYAFNRLAPNWAYRNVEDLLLTPISKKVRKANLPHGIQLMKIDTKEGALQGYKLGHGPTVVFVHGWSGGAYQFFPLMRGLSQCGYKALAFDHFAHGHSEGKHASLLRFTSAVNSVLKQESNRSTEGLAAVVGHSMGCIAIANANSTLIKGIPLLLISPVFNFKAYFRKQLDSSGLHPNVIKKYQSRFEASYFKDLDKMELNVKLKDYHTDTAIIHDKTDAETDYLDSVKFCSSNPLTNLIITRKYGHNRIINSETVWQQLKSHINYEDITTNTSF